MKKVLFVANTKKDKDLIRSNEILKTLLEKGFEVYVDESALKINSTITVVGNKNLEPLDLMLVLGGDGTILKYARKYGEYQLPILGINLGRVGALAFCEMSNYHEYLDKFLQGDYVLVNHIALEGQIKRLEGKAVNFTAYNDVVLHRGFSSKLLKINIAVDNSDFSEVYADGVIVATPAGSSAYNLSAGGPLLSTSCGCYVITPICPQSKTFTSLVVSKEDEVHLTVGENVNVNRNQNVVIVDGYEEYPINAYDKILIKKSNKVLQMIQFSQQKSLYESVYKAVVGLIEKEKM